MKKKQDKARCISCAHYDDEAHVCTHGAGLLREIELSESLAEACLPTLNLTETMSVKKRE